jgi:hypothetical protein
MKEEILKAASELNEDAAASKYESYKTSVKESLERNYSEMEAKDIMHGL